MIKFIIVILCAVPLFVLAEGGNNKQDYKCHINTAKGDKVVFYRWKSQGVALKIASLPGKQLVDTKGKKYFIQDVVECVPLTEVFSSDNSKALDERTLR